MCRIKLPTMQRTPPNEPPYHPPVKRSVQIAGHKTSISLEPLFWDMLKAAAETADVPINAIVARIDAERIKSDTPPGLASAVRIWLVTHHEATEPVMNRDNTGT